MGFLGALATLVPHIETLVQDVVQAIKGGATSTPASQDGTATGDTAKAIAQDSNFKNAVSHKQPNNAANAAAAVVPSSSVQQGASKSLSASGTLAKNVSTQLKAVVNAVTPCQEAEDAVFALVQIIPKAKLDADDKALLTNLWTSASQNISAILGTTKDHFSELGDPGAIAAFSAIANFASSTSHAALDSWMKKPGDSAPISIQTSANNLWNWLNTATIVGVTTLSQIANGLDLIPQVQPPAASNAAKTSSTGKLIATNLLSETLTTPQSGNDEGIGKLMAMAATSRTRITIEPSEPKGDNDSYDG